ncbi:MAG: endonuclease/exonuclease/phosphatase family protein [Nocardioidaceae bacterium]|nr:endonuclease/exonuclease/phosphatase family protein [Nocardioidaceae bacterium]
MPDHAGKRRHAGRAELLPVLAIVLAGVLIVGIAMYWRHGPPEASIDQVSDRAVDRTTQTRTGAELSDPDRARKDHKDAVVNRGVVKPLRDAAQLREDARAAEAEVTNVNQKSVTFKMASFNVLASQHTEPGGQHAGWPGAGVRSGQTVGLIKAHHADVVGLQEVKSSQLSAITGGTGFRAWPGGGDPDNSVIYNPSKFEYVSGTTFSVWFMSRNRPQTVLRLRHKQSRREFYVINMHPSAGHGGRYASSRNAAFDTVVSYINKLKSERVPIFLTGDMNDRGNFYCRVVSRTGLVAAQGGGGTCGSAPRMRPVDWVTAWGNVSFSGYVDDFSSENRRISDHPFVSATATMRGAQG